jgi:hypothetical protein
MARRLCSLALPLILVVTGWAASAHAQGAAAAGSNGSQAVPGPVFSGTGPDAAAHGAVAGFPVGTRATASLVRLEISWVPTAISTSCFHHAW